MEVVSFLVHHILFFLEHSAGDAAVDWKMDAAKMLPDNVADLLEGARASFLYILPYACDGALMLIGYVQCRGLAGVMSALWRRFAPCVLLRSLPRMPTGGRTLNTWSANWKAPVPAFCLESTRLAVPLASFLSPPPLPPLPAFFPGS